MTMDLTNVFKYDLVRIAYWMLAVVEQAGMEQLLYEYADGAVLPDETEASVIRRQ